MRRCGILRERRQPAIDSSPTTKAGGSPHGSQSKTEARVLGLQAEGVEVGEVVDLPTCHQHRAGSLHVGSSLQSEREQGENTAMNKSCSSHVVEWRHGTVQ